MTDNCDLDYPLIDNIYAFVGWVVAYSDYGKELTVDSVLKKYRLIDRVTDNRKFVNIDEYEIYENFLERYKNDKDEIEELEIRLTGEEIQRCDDVRHLFTQRFRRARAFTKEQIIEYKAKKAFFKDSFVNIKKIEPVKLVDHESKRVVGVFASSTEAAKVFKASVRKIRHAVEKKTFYKGYVWMPCDIETYKTYEKEFGNKCKCRTLSKKPC